MSNLSGVRRGVRVRSHASYAEAYNWIKRHCRSCRLKEINWLNINDRFSQCVLSSIYNFFNSESPEYFNKIYFPAEPSNINTRSSFQRLKQPLRKSNKGLNSASHSGPSLWNKLPVEIKRSGSINSFKHNVENYYLTKMEHTGLLISS